ncbi:MAG: YbhB/YbcL family Raf kinase inhibitor-like protein [Rhizobacter sp.]|nr:YbhB/YbcL family Raf kinase inhibitor-like protein [Rhizobacter sp.]
MTMIDALALERETPRTVAPRDISVVGVRKTFGVTKALDGCSFSASRGEIHAIVGGNGCGKSTLAKVLSGVLPPDSGQVLVFGHTPTSPHEARQVGIATVFQEVMVAEESSVVDNLFLGADALFSRAMPQRAKSTAAAALMLELTGLPIDPGTLVGTLPLGLKQWITIGRALLCKPRALILDESSAALDLDSTQRLFAKLRQLRDEGSAIIIVTHRIAELIEISDRATVLRDGRDVGVLERRQITEKSLLQLMTGKASAPAGAGAGAAGARATNDAAVHPPELLMKAEGLKVWPGGPDVAFRLHRGEILGVAGLDGQGQSEFVRILAGVDRAANGAPMVAHPGLGFVPVRSLADAADCGVSYVSGDRKREGIFPNLSIFENLLLPRYRSSARAGKLKILDWAALRSVFDWEAQKLSVRMGDRSDRITSLSGGNQQKVLIGRAFALNPTILVLNDPARGVDVGAKTDLYQYLKNFAATGKSVVYLSSEIEELVGLCERVLVFRGGTIFEELAGVALHPAAVLQAMFGQARGAHDPRPHSASQPAPHRPGPTDETTTNVPGDEPATDGRFGLWSPAFDEGARIPARYAEHNRVSPPIMWEHPPKGTKSFALAVTDPDLPAHFNFPRAFAHWLAHDIPAATRKLLEGAAAKGLLPPGMKELNSDFVTFGIPGFGKGYGGPWPPDATHRYVFTLYALKCESLQLAATANYVDFVSAVLPVTITTASLTGLYGPARQPLPTA